jgi:Na+/phosphate symporter
MAWSSLAVVLLTAAFVGSGVISLKVGLFLVIGANLGSGIVAVVATAGSGTAGRRVALGNLLFKLAGCVLHGRAAAVDRSRAWWRSTPIRSAWWSISTPPSTCCSRRR